MKYSIIKYFAKNNTQMIAGTELEHHLYDDGSGQMMELQERAKIKEMRAHGLKVVSVSYPTIEE